MLSLISILFSYCLLICFGKKLKKIYEFKKYKIWQKPYILKVRKKSERKPKRGTGERTFLERSLTGGNF
jgi:hypothetical protein